MAIVARGVRADCPSVSRWRLSAALTRRLSLMRGARDRPFEKIAYQRDCGRVADLRWVPGPYEGRARRELGDLLCCRRGMERVVAWQHEHRHVAGPHEVTVDAEHE